MICQRYLDLIMFQWWFWRAVSLNFHTFYLKQKQIYRTVGPLLAASLDPLTHCGNVASFSVFYSHYFNGCSSELAELAPLPHSCGRSTRYSNRFHDIFVTIPRCCKYVNNIPRTARLWNSFPAESFPLINDLIPSNDQSLELIDPFSPWNLSKQFPYILFIFFF